MAWCSSFLAWVSPSGLRGSPGAPSSAAPGPSRTCSGDAWDPPWSVRLSAPRCHPSTLRPGPPTVCPLRINTAPRPTDRVSLEQIGFRPCGSTGSPNARHFFARSRVVTSWNRTCTQRQASPRRRHPLVREPSKAALQGQGPPPVATTSNVIPCLLQANQPLSDAPSLRASSRASPRSSPPSSKPAGARETALRRA